METPRKPFYVVGGTLKEDAASYVVRAADADLLEGLRAGDFCYILDTRQVGKSSLIVRAAATLRQEGVTVAFLDLTQIGRPASAREWYYGLLLRLGDETGCREAVRDFWRANADLGPLQRWMNALTSVVIPRVTGPLVVVVDEIDAVRSLPFPTDEFFAGIRELFNRRSTDGSLRRVTFCLAGAAAPQELIGDAKTTPFNIGRRIVVTDFTEEEAAPLAAGLAPDTHLAGRLLRRVLHWTAGHPYLTQSLCAAVRSDGKVGDAPGVDHVCSDLFLSQAARRADANLHLVSDRILKSADPAALLSLYDQILRRGSAPDDPAGPLVVALTLSGVVRVRDSALMVRNRIYARVFSRRWVRDNMPEAEKRRQHAAAARARMQVGAVAFVVIAVLAAMLWVTVRARRDSQEALLRANRLLYDSQCAQIQQAAEADPPQTLLVNDLLEETRASPNRGFEWGYWRCRTPAKLAEMVHGAPVSSVAFSPDGRRLATGSGDGIARVWDAATGRQTLALKGHPRSTISVAFSPDGERLATGSDSDATRLWNAASGRQVLALKSHSGWVSPVAFSPDSKRLATGSGDGTARVWDTATGRQVVVVKGHGGWVLSAAFSPDGKRLATGGLEDRARVWDAATGRQMLVLEGHSGPIESVAFSPDGEWLVTGSNDGTARLWDAASGRHVLALKCHSGWVSPVAFSPDCKRLATGSDGGMARVWDTATGHQVLVLTGHSDCVKALAFSPDGRRMATGSGDGTARVWSAVTGRQVLALEGNGRVGYPVAFSPDGKRLATGSDDGTTRVWDTATGNMRQL